MVIPTGFTEWKHESVHKTWKTTGKHNTALGMGPKVKHTYHFKALSWDTMALPVGLLKLSSAQKQNQIKVNKSKQKDNQTTTKTEI